MNKREGDINPEVRHRLTEEIEKSSAYRLAFQDLDFLAEDVLRAERLGLELNKPELYMRRRKVRSTIAVFGSARTVPPDEAEAALAGARKALDATPGDSDAQSAVRRAERDMANSKHYEVARQFAQIVSADFVHDHQADLVVITGGGPGIMEAANRGAFDAGAPTAGFNITIPEEQAPNPFITPDLCFQFHYFAIRKMHFLLRAMALVAFPGGYGTMDELFEALTLVQTGKMQRIPIVLVGREFWSKAVNFDFLVEQGNIAPEDAELLSIVDTAEEAVKSIYGFYGRSIPEPDLFY
jgi:uncharacterized protein (TIGR00730 family)